MSLTLDRVYSHSKHIMCFYKLKRRIRQQQHGWGWWEGRWRITLETMPATTNGKGKRLGQCGSLFFAIFLSVPSTGDDNWFPLLCVNARCAACYEHYALFRWFFMHIFFLFVLESPFSMGNGTFSLFLFSLTLFFSLLCKEKQKN